MCQLLGFPHPDYLLPLLTWEQWHDWQLFAGEQRAAGGALPAADADPSQWSPDTRRQEWEALKKHADNLPPEVKEKLKRLREQRGR